ncbi:MAG: LamG domain-containing protein [Planctomycetales bacterium]|nr:LamG domain-containing protein [Planctomycetales bacterium]
MSHCGSAEGDELSASVIFHAPFDQNCDAWTPTGQVAIRTATTLARREVKVGNHSPVAAIEPGSGKFGDALRFRDNAQPVLFYPGHVVGYREKDWSGTISFWLRLDPERDLKPDYSDPLQITQRKWNDAALWVDFDQSKPRSFRLGVIPDYQVWNPSDTPWDDIPDAARPIVTVARPPFQRESWTHVALTFTGANPSSDAEGLAVLYLNGRSQGTVRRPLRFSWDIDQTALMIGILYIGDFDDLAAFNRALTAAEIQRVYQLEGGIHKLLMDRT